MTSLALVTCSSVAVESTNDQEPWMKVHVLLKAQLIFSTGWAGY